MGLPFKQKSKETSFSSFKPRFKKTRFTYSDPKFKKTKVAPVLPIIPIKPKIKKPFNIFKLKLVSTRKVRNLWQRLRGVSKKTVILFKKAFLKYLRYAICYRRYLKTGKPIPTKIRPITVRERLLIILATRRVRSIAYDFVPKKEITEAKELEVLKKQNDIEDIRRESVCL